MGRRTPRSSPDSEAEPVAKVPLVLVADDDPITLNLLATILRESGYDVEGCADGQEAVDRVAKGGIDLALLDATMPRLSGLEACRVIKGMSVDSFLPVLIATVKTDPTSRVEGLRIGADDYVCKPFEESDLQSRVEGLLRIKRVHDEMQAARAKLERVSVHDELTGLYNYRYLHTRLETEFKRAERLHEPLSCCVLDVDRLKTQNERGGRALGDTILRGVADVIRKCVRDSDVIARYGGDEFLIMLPATHFAGSLSVADRILRDVNAQTWQSRGGPAKITASIGIALFPSRDVRTKDALLKSADVALMQSKREGGARICVFQQQGFMYAPDVARQAPAAERTEDIKKEAKGGA
jgi:two-component system cell cycle response regulator